MRAAAAAVARAARWGDPLAERAARRRLAAAQLARALDTLQDQGLRFTAEQVEWLSALLRSLAGPAEGEPASGAEVLARVHDAVTAAEAAEDATCDRCGGPAEVVSASYDATGTQAPPMTLVRLCEGCSEAEARATSWGDQ